MTGNRDDARTGARRGRRRLVAAFGTLVLAAGMLVVTATASGAAPIAYTSNAYTDHILTVDLATGSTTALGAPGLSGDVTWADLALSPGGTLYGVLAGSVDKLYTIDTSTGAATEVGDLGTSGSNVGIDFTLDGTLWMVRGNALYRVDTSTGAATLATSLSLGTASGLAAHCSGSLFVIASGQGALYRIDDPAGTPSVSLVGSLGLATVNSPKIDFDSSGTLWGRNTYLGQAIYTIDTSTGAASPTGQSVNVGGAGLALPSGTPCAAQGTTTTTAPSTTSTTALQTTTTTTPEDDPEPTTTTIAPETTSTPSTSSPSTTAPGVQTLASTGSTSTTQAAAVPAAGELPYTGGSDGPLAATAFVLIATGGLALALTGRREARGA